VSAVERLRELPPELRNAGLAAAALALTLFLPWYTQSYVPEGSREFVKRNVSAFGVFSFVEAAVLLVAAAVLFFIWARSEGRAFHLPGGDGAAIMAAGGWAVLLIVWRLFDKPNAAGPSTDYGLQWGIAAALAAAAALTVAGARVRAVHRPEPPNPIAEEEEPEPAVERPPRTPRRRAESTAVTEVLGESPDWSGDVPEPPRRARPSRARDDEEPTREDRPL
jgi:hypothetical protein